MTPDTALPEPHPPTPRPRRVYLLVLAGAVALYWSTAQPGVTWQDSGIHQLRALRQQYTNPMGLALAHPLLILMAQPLRLAGDARLPLAMNLLSGLGMALTVANVYLLGYRLTARHGPAVGGAALLAIGHTAWWLATVTESYCWVTAGLTAELLLLYALLTRPRWWQVGLLGLVNGLGLSLHNFALLPLGVYVIVVAVLVVRRRLVAGALAAGAVAWLVGAAPLLVLVVDAGWTSGDWPATIRSTLFGDAWQSDVLSGSATTVAKGMMYMALNWPWLSFAPVILGWVCLARQYKRPFVAALGAVTLIHLVFAIRYPVPDQFMFLLPTYALLAIAAAVGLSRIPPMRPRWRRAWLAAVAGSIALTPVLYGLTPVVLARMGLCIRPERYWPYRDETRYWITPWRLGEGSAQRFAREAFQTAAENSVILPAGMATPPLQALQKAEGLRPDVLVLDILHDDSDPWTTDPQGLRNYFAGRPVYAVVSVPSLVPDAWEPHVRTRVEYPLVAIEPTD